MALRRSPELSVYEYQQNVKDKDLTAPPAIPAEGDRYIVGAAATGAWASKDRQIAYYYNAAWNFDVPTEGWQTWVEDEDKHYTYDGTSWMIMMNDGDMKKSVYDTDNDGIVDKAENVDDGAGNASTAAQVKSAVDLKHAQNTDQYLDQGGANEISAANAKTSYDRKASYNAVLKAVTFDLP